MEIVLTVLQLREFQEIMLERIRRANGEPGKSAPGDEKPPKGYSYAKGGITIPKSKIKGKKRKKKHGK